MELVRIGATSIASIIVLFLLTKWIGNKQMSQLSMFDYVNGITIGSIAAEMATAEKGELLDPLVAMTLYAVIAVAISFATSKSIFARRFLTGRSITLMEDGKLYRQNFCKTRFDLNEFLTLCRVSGFFDLSQIDTAILEPNGHLSILPKSSFRPATPEDLNQDPVQTKPAIAVIIDGVVLHRNLKQAGNDEKWLAQQLKRQKIDHPKRVFLATCDRQNNLSVYVKLAEAPTNDLFQ